MKFQQWHYWKVVARTIFELCVLKNYNFVSRFWFLRIFADENFLRMSKIVFSSFYLTKRWKNVVILLELGLKFFFFISSFHFLLQVFCVRPLIYIQHIINKIQDFDEFLNFYLHSYSQRPVNLTNRNVLWTIFSEYLQLFLEWSSFEIIFEDFIFFLIWHRGLAAGLLFFEFWNYYGSCHFAGLI